VFLVVCRMLFVDLMMNVFLFFGRKFVACRCLLRLVGWLCL